ncbi:MAG: Hsp20/alpha crystallin family protein [Chitinophagaceae bacterium]
MSSLIKRKNGDTSMHNFAMPSLFNDFFTRDLFNWGSDFSTSGTNIPAVNIKENNEAFEVEMAAPGMNKKDFKIELEGNRLTISSEKNEEHEERNEENYSRKEFSYQSFYRTFNLPKDIVDADKIKAKYDNGLLQLIIPKREEAKQKPPRMIEIA